MTSVNDFGRWVRRMRRYTDTTLMDMSETFAAKPSALCGLEVSRDGKVYTEKQKKLIKYYFQLVCEEKGLPFPGSKSTVETAETEEKMPKLSEEDKKVVHFLKHLWGL